MTIANATHAQLTQMGYVVTRLETKGPRRSDLVMTQTKGTRTRTNRRHTTGNIPREI
jgi:hypothetical protein